MMVINIDPWRSLDQEKPFEFEASVKRYNREVLLPSQSAKSLDQRLFSGNMIQNVMLLQNKIDKNDQIMLSVQYNHCLVTTSLNTTKCVIQTRRPEMLMRHQVRGDNDEIYFGVSIGDRDKIMKLRLHDTLIDKVLKTDVFEMNSKLIAFQSSLDYEAD